MEVVGEEWGWGVERGMGRKNRRREASTSSQPYEAADVRSVALRGRTWGRMLCCTLCRTCGRTLCCTLCRTSLRGRTPALPVRQLRSARGRGSARHGAARIAARERRAKAGPRKALEAQTRGSAIAVSGSHTPLLSASLSRCFVRRFVAAAPLLLLSDDASLHLSGAALRHGARPSFPCLPAFLPLVLVVVAPLTDALLVS